MKRKNPGESSTLGWLALGGVGAAILYFVSRRSAATDTLVVPESQPTSQPVRHTTARPVIASAVAQIPPTAVPRTTNLSASDQNLIRGIQDRLREIGFQPGPSTGELNHDTNYAIATFQRSQGLTADGVLNGITATRLASVYERKQQQRLQTTIAYQSFLRHEMMFWNTFGPVIYGYRVMFDDGSWAQGGEQARAGTGS